MRLIPPNLKDNLRKQLDLWLKNEVIEPSSSPWSSPLVPVTKKTGETRFVLDYCRVNDLSVTDSFPTPNISEILNSLGKARYFCCLDASNAYHAIEVEKSSRPIIAFATAFGLYQFARMPFGLKNAGASYCRFVQFYGFGSVYMIIRTSQTGSKYNPSHASNHYFRRRGAGESAR